jgi:hypothetical protein
MAIGSCAFASAGSARLRLVEVKISAAFVEISIDKEKWV